MKNKMYRSMAALALILAMAVMGGCGSSGGGEGTSSDSGAKKETKKEENTKVNMDEQTLVEKDGVTVTATGAGVDGEDGIYLDVIAENKTEKVYEISLDNAAVNGFSMNGYAKDEIMPGETKTRISFSDWADKYVDLGEPGEIKIHLLRLLEVEEDQTVNGEKPHYMPVEGAYENPFAAVEDIVIQTSAYDEMKATLPEGEELYHENGIQITRVDADKEPEEGGIRDIFLVKNDSSDIIYLGGKDYTMNDYVIEEMMYEAMQFSEVMPGETGSGVMLADSSSLQYVLNTEEEVEFESMECTIYICKRIEADEWGRTGETIAEIPYSYTAK